MRDVNGGPDVEVITTPQVVVGYEPSVIDLEVYLDMIEELYRADYPTHKLIAAHQLGRRIFGVSYTY